RVVLPPGFRSLAVVEAVQHLKVLAANVAHDHAPLAGRFGQVAELAVERQELAVGADRRMYAPQLRQVRDAAHFAAAGADPDAPHLADVPRIGVPAGMPPFFA